MSVEDPYEGQKFSSFEELKKYLEDYGNRNFMKFWIRSSHTISSQKTRSPKKINPSLKYVCMKFACIFGGEKIRCRGTGIRRSSTYRNLGCPCMINAVVGDDGNHVKLETVVLDHNHALCQSLFDSLKNSKNAGRVTRSYARKNKNYVMRQSLIPTRSSSRISKNNTSPRICKVAERQEPNAAGVTARVAEKENIADNAVLNEANYVQSFIKTSKEKYGNNITVIVVKNKDSETVEKDNHSDEDDDIKNESDVLEDLNLAAEKEICRLCLSSRNKLSPIFKPSLPVESTVLSFKIMSCASIEISNNDELPCNICTICEEILDIAYNFRMRCEKSDSVLRKMYSPNSFRKYIEIVNPKSMDLIRRDVKKEESARVKHEVKDIADEVAKVELTSVVQDENENAEDSKTMEDAKNIDNEISQENLFDKSDRTCQICSREFENCTDLLLHMREHSDIENMLLTCNFCGVIFTVIRSLLDHMNEHLLGVQHDWDTKIFTCTQCELSFFTMEDAKAHEEMHATRDVESFTVEVQTEKTATGHGYVCSVCGKVLKSKDRYQSHRNMHEGLRPHVCPECGRGFADRKNMHQHYDIVHLRKAEHECPICHKKFYAPTKMKSHMTVHYGVKPFSCDVCGKTFRLKMNMAKHKKTHSNERPHKCDKCDAAFIDKNLLTRHSYVHGGLRPYACSYCGHRFTLKFNLKKHLGRCSVKKKHKDSSMDQVDEWVAITDNSSVELFPNKCDAVVKYQTVVKCEPVVKCETIVKCEPNEEKDFRSEGEALRMGILRGYEERE